MSVRIARWAFLFSCIVWACVGPANLTLESARAEEAAPAKPKPTLEVATDKALLSFPVFTDPGELPRLTVVTADTKANSVELPVKKTAVRIKLSEFVAEVEVEQTFENTQSSTIEAIYTFPLPENAAVHRMKMIVRGRTIEAHIAERERARATYEEAKKKGFTASLLEQERPNVFTQSVVNIPANELVVVTTGYVQDLSYDAGVYELVFPLVIGPRYVGGSPLHRANTGSGYEPDTSSVPDASRISPPYVGRGMRSGRDVSVEVETAKDLAVDGYTAVTHKLVKEARADGSLTFTLADANEIPNRDFVMRYRVAAEKPRALLQMGGTNDKGFFSLVVNPPKLDIDALVGSREIMFVVDISGSMSGAPLALCQSAMRKALEKLRPGDTFNLLTFAGATTKAFDSPRPANKSNVKEALAVIDKLRAGGSTQMIDAVATALDSNVEKGRHRYVFFLTDGYVGAEEQILSSTTAFVKALEERSQRAKVFGFGVGASPNRSLLEGISRNGKGLSVYATTREDPARAVNAFYRYIDSSVLRDVSIDWGGGEVADATPAELPDLFASHPLIIHGKFTKAPSRAPTLHATAATGAISIPVQIVKSDQGAGEKVLGLLWGRARVTDLETDFLSGDTTAKQKITDLGLQFGLVTRFTSFIAVDTTERVGDGTQSTVVQPQDLPEGMTMDLSTKGGGIYAPEPSVDLLAASPSQRGCACRTDGTSTSVSLSSALALLALVCLRLLLRRKTPKSA